MPYKCNITAKAGGFNDSRSLVMSLMSSPEARSQVRFVEVSPEYQGQRIDNFLLRTLKGAPKSLIYRILRKGEVRVNQARIKPDYRLQPGDQVRIPPLRLGPQKPAVTSSPAVITNSGAGRFVRG